MFGKIVFHQLLYWRFLPQKTISTVQFSAIVIVGVLDYKGAGVRAASLPRSVVSRVPIARRPTQIVIGPALRGVLHRYLRLELLYEVTPPT